MGISIDKYLQQPIDVSRYLDPEPEPTFTRYLGSTLKYLWDATKPRSLSQLFEPTIYNAAKGSIEQGFQPDIKFLNEFGNKLVKTKDEIAQFIGSTKFASLGGTTVPISLGFSPSNPFKEGGTAFVKHASEGLINSFVVTPIEFFTSTVNDNGVARPTTVEEQVSKTLEMTSTVGMIATASAMNRAILPGLKGEGAVQFMRQATLGRYGQVIAKDAGIGLAAGAVQGSIANIGQEHYIDKIISGSLAMLPVGALFGMFAARGYNVRAFKAAEEAVTTGSFNAGLDAAAINGLRIDHWDSLEDIASKTDALAKNDDLVKALVQSKLDVGKGVIVPSLLSDETKAYLTQESHTYLEGPDGNTLVNYAGNPLSTTKRNFFKKTGFLPNDIVALADGTPFRITKHDADGNLYLEGILNGKRELIISPKAREGIRRFFNTVDGVGELSAETYFDKMYAEFKKSGFSLDGQTPFSDLYYKFLDKMGIKSQQDAQTLMQGFYQRIKKDWMSTLDDGDKNVYLQVSKQLEEMADQIRQDKGQAFYKAAATNGLYIIPRGAGRYDIQFIEGGNLFKTVGSADEGIKEISTLGFTGAKDLDGGNGNVIPPSVYAVGNSSTPLQPKGKPTWLDYKNVGRMGVGITPIMNTFRSFDELYGTSLTTLVGDPLQRGMENIKTLMMTPKGKRVVGLRNELVDFARENKITIDELHTIQDSIEARSIPEMESLLDTLSKAVAKTLSTIDVDGLVEYMYQVKKKARGIAPGDKKFDAIAESIAKEVDSNGNRKYDANVVAVGNDFWINPAYNGRSIPTILQLAQAYKNPALALDMAAFDAKYISRKEVRQMRDKLLAFYKAGESAFDVKARPISNIKSYIGGGGDPLLDTPQSMDLYDEIGEMGFDGAGHLERNPIELANSFMMAGFRTIKSIDEAAAFAMQKEGLSYTPAGRKVSTRDVFNRIRFEATQRGRETGKKYSGGEIAKLPEEARSAAFDLINQHIMDSRGIPRLDERLGRAVEKVWKQRFGLDSRSATALATIAYMGGRPIYAFRDLTSAMSNMYSMYGAVESSKILLGSVSKSYAKHLIEKGVIPDLQGLDMLTPTDDIAIGYSRVSKMANTAIKYSGQHIIYTKLSAGIYRWTTDQVSEFGGKYVRKEITKEKLIDKLDLDLIPKSVVDDIFTRLDSQGNGVEYAADVLGRWRIRQNLNIFGNHNTPIGWQGAWGRVLGHLGSWGVNELQTMNDFINRGSGLKRAGRIARYVATQGTILAAGYEAGLDMWNWIVSPLGLFSIGPIISNTSDILMSAGQALFSNDERRKRAAENVLKRFSPVSFSWEGKRVAEIVHLNQMYIPYGAAMNDYINSVDAMNRQFGYGQGLFRAMGGMLDMTHQSPLQQVTGDQPIGPTGYSLPQKPMIPFGQP